LSKTANQTAPALMASPGSPQPATRQYPAPTIRNQTAGTCWISSLSPRPRSLTLSSRHTKPSSVRAGGIAAGVPCGQSWLKRSHHPGESGASQAKGRHVPPITSVLPNSGRSLYMETAHFIRIAHCGLDLLVAFGPFINDSVYTPVAPARKLDG
jgi:hypothetical protein